MDRAEVLRFNVLQLKKSNENVGPITLSCASGIQIGLQ